MSRRVKIACCAIAGTMGAGAAAVGIAVLGFSYPVEAISKNTGGPLIVTDRHGHVLRKVAPVDGRPGQEGWVPLEQIRSHAILAVLVSEDRRFYEHLGVDPIGIARAAWLNLRSGRTGYGGSTITMQLMRMIHSPGQRRTWGNKIKEAVLALRAERALTKNEILEQYLNRAYYGNGAYGIEAAARTYFGKPAASLSTAQATLLSIVPRGPVQYDPIKHLDRAVSRRDHVLELLCKHGMMTRAEKDRVRAEPIRVGLHRPPFEAPHFVDWVLASLPPQLKRPGGTVRTTLDLRLQRQLAHRLAEHVKRLSSRGLDQAGLVVLDTRTGQVLAMVGSPGFFERQGQLNITTWRRHPGSALKPFVYALALESGDNPASIAYDIHDVKSAYRVKKVTQKEHGPVRYREALAGSYNLAAVHVLEEVGEERLITRLRQAGVGDVPGDPKDYNLRLALGATKVRLIDLAAGYGFLARQGKVTPPRSVLAFSVNGGPFWHPPEKPDQEIFSPQVSWLVADMLADPEARRTAFGHELPVDQMPFEIAFKTGTSRGFADTVAVGVTEQLTVAAWAGNFDGRPTEGVIAMDAAAPLVRAGMMLGARGRRLTLPPKPEGIVQATVCPLSGQKATDNCPHAKREYFRQDHQPTEPCTWHVRRGNRVAVRYPEEIASWAQRTSRTGGRGIRSPKRIN